MANIIPIKSLTTQEVLYGDRTTSYRWEVFTHPPVRRNLLRNPSGQVNLQGYVMSGLGSGLVLEPGLDVYATSTSANQPPGNFGVYIDGLVIGTDIAPNTQYEFTLEAYAASGGAIKQPALYAVTQGVGGTAGYQFFPATSTFTRQRVTFTSGSSGTVLFYVLNGEATSTGTSIVGFRNANVELSSTFDPAIPYFDGRPNNVSYFEGVANYSPSFMVPTTDRLLGVLDGVSEGSLSWTQNAAVKGRGKAKVIDLASAQEGLLRIGGLKLESMRVRPVCIINPGDSVGHYEPVWTESGRNFVTTPQPTVYANSGWAASSINSMAANPGWVGGSAGAAVTPYVFMGASSRAYAVGDKVTLRIRYRVDATSAGSADYISVLPHKRSTNTYYRGSHTNRPVVVGQVEDVVIQWTTTVAFAVGDLDLAVAASNSAGTALANVNAGFSLRATRGMIEDGYTAGEFYDGSTVSTTPTRRYRWLGTANASVSVAEDVTDNVWKIDGPVIPEIPWGMFLVSAASEEWKDTGRVWNLELLDRATVPSQDKVDQSYAVAAGTPILKQVRNLLATTGEHLAIDETSTLATSTGMVWEAGTSKLSIINDLLDVAGYNSLWVDGFGNFQATPRILPANRSVMYEALGVPRELRDGQQAIYKPQWTRDRDSFEVPNKVIAVQSAPGEGAAAIIGTWTNQDSNSPYSYQARGRWIPYVLDSVECPAGTAAEILAFLQKRAQTTLVQMSAVQAQVKAEHLPIPVRVSDVIRFSNTKAAVDSRHVITNLELDTTPTGLMKSTLQEVISL
jgi:hypothetical protein